MLSIVIICYNIDSRIFILQIEAIRKFCKDEFTIYILDNSTDLKLAESIRYHSERLKVYYKKCNAATSNGSESHAWAANLSYSLLKGTGSDFFLYLDHDCVPVQEFSIKEILGDNFLFAGMGQGKNGITYYWPGLVAWDNKKVDNELIDFSPITERGLDTGGKLHLAVEKYGKEKCVFFDEAYYQNPYFNGKAYTHYAMINKGMFCHLINASGWNKIEDQEERINSLINVLQDKTSINVD